MSCVSIHRVCRPFAPERAQMGANGCDYPEIPKREWVRMKFSNHNKWSMFSRVDVKGLKMAEMLLRVRSIQKLVYNG